LNAKPNGALTVRPVLIDGRESTSTPRKVIVDQPSLRPGGPIWIETHPRFWTQGVITRVVHSEVHVSSHYVRL
jgi:hypothetical protein